MTKQEYAVEQFRKGFNCSQAVFSAFCEEIGLDRQTALKVSCGFGGGMRQAEVCGAVSGAIMALGLKHGQCVGSDKESKDRTYSLVKEFNKRFIDTNGSIICKELLGCDISKPEEQKLARERGLFDNICPRLIKDAAGILEGIL